MRIHGLPALRDNYIWVFQNDQTNTFTAVDPGEADPVLMYAKTNRLTLKNILITHDHWDHIGGVKALQQAFPLVQIHTPESLSFGKNEIQIDDLRFEVLQTPGHTRLHVCYFEPHKKWLFCGDTLFSGGCGRVFDGTLEQLYHSLEKLKALPDDTLVFCAHEYTQRNLTFAQTVDPENALLHALLKKLNQKECSLPSTIEQEKKINPFFKAIQGDLTAFAITENIDPSDTFALFKRIRALKDIF